MDVRNYVLRNMIGLDNLLNSLDTSNSAFPPYNIEKTDENNYVLSLAVAGYGENEISVTVERKILTISGTKEKTDKEYIYQGIAFRDFTKSIRLAEYIEVTGAVLKDGMLTINLERRVPKEQLPRKIEINNGTSTSSRKAKGNSTVNVDSGIS